MSILTEIIAEIGRIVVPISKKKDVNRSHTNYTKYKPAPRYIHVSKEPIVNDKGELVWPKGVTFKHA